MNSWREIRKYCRQQRLLYFNMVILLVLVGLTSCYKGPEVVVPAPDTESNDDIINCDECFQFGQFIEFYENQLIIAEYQNVYIYEKEDNVWKLKFENTKSNSSGIQSLIVRDNRMALGIADADGIGSVEIYTYRNDTWELDETLSLNRFQNNFGSSIDIDGDKMIIGANAPWADGPGTFINEDAGSVHIYKRSGSSWSKEADLEPPDSRADDLFGDAVAIHGNLALAGGRSTTGLHLYRYDGEEWLLDSLIDLSGTLKISHFEDKLLVRSSGSEPELIAYNITEDGQIVEDLISTDFGGEELSGRGEIIQVSAGQALVDLEQADQCYLLIYDAGSWSEKEILQGSESIFCEYYGLAIGQTHMAIGGNNYVFIIDN